MKALNFNETKTLVQIIGPALERGQLQDIYSNDRGLALGFHLRGKTKWLIIDLIPNSPSLLLFENWCPWKKSVKHKPVSLFLRAHGVNLYVQSLELLESLGRVALLRLTGGGQQVEIEIQLIPKQANLLVRTESKSISWEKPKVLSEPPAMDPLIISRTVDEIHEEWKSEYSSPLIKVGIDPREVWEKQKLRNIEKKKKALIEIDKQFEDNIVGKWFRLGDSIKEQWSIKELESDLLALVDPALSVQENMGRAYNKAKQIQQKQSGALLRKQVLVEEINKLNKMTYSEGVRQQELSTKKRDLLQQSESRGRKLILNDGAIAYVGKSATDNLAILRAAKAWDLWLHLRDYPGAHAVIHRNKDQILSDTELNKVAGWVAKESASSKNLLSGSRLSVVVVECRYVRPIKGDKTGRVNYTHPRVLEVII